MLNNNSFLFKPANRDIKTVSKIFFACHPDDFNLYFEDITDEILEKATNNNISAVFTYINPEANFDFEESKDFIENMQLIVVPVTWKLLSTGNAIINQVIPYVLEKHIPVLPLLQNSDLVNEYSKHFGDIQFLYDDQNDKTAIPYDIKLNDFIKDTLVGDELRRRVQAAFDAYIFLSYRKKDRKFAQEIMRLIHENEFCRDIAIWYDEFLTPGEDFTKSIKAAIEKSDLFAMVITPSIVEPDNYIIQHEYPMASTAEKTILPLESVETDKEKLGQYYENIPPCTDVHNQGELSSALLQNLKEIALQENDNSPEHNYLIGLAYLTGIDVEINYQRGIELIKKAADAELPEAVARMITICRTGTGCAVDYDACNAWSERLIAIFKKLYPEYDKDGWLRILNTLFGKLMLHNATHDFEATKTTAAEVISYATALQKEGENLYILQILVMAYLSLSAAATQLFIKGQTVPDIIQALAQGIPYLTEAEKFLNEYNERHPERSETGLLMLICTQLFSIYTEQRETDKVKEYFDKRVAIAEKENMQILIDEFNYQWASYEKSCQTDFNDPASIAEFFNFTITHFNQDVVVAKDTAAGYFIAASQASALISLVASTDSAAFLTKDYLSFVEKSLACYDLIPEKYITNAMLISLKQILSLGADAAKNLDETDSAFDFYKRIYETDKEIFARHKTISNANALHYSLLILSTFALKQNRLDAAFEYGSKNNDFCIKMLKNYGYKAAFLTNFVNAISFLTRYFIVTENTEKALHTAESAQTTALYLAKKFESADSLQTLGETEFALAALLYDNDKLEEALKHIQLSDGAYSTIVTKFANKIKPDKAETFVGGFSDTLKLYGDILYFREEWKKAIEQYTRYLKMAEDNELLTETTNNVLYKLARAYELDNNAQKSKKIFTKFLERMPKIPTNKFDLYFVSIANFHLAIQSKKPDIERLQLAKEGFEKLLSIEPENESYLNGLAITNEYLTEFGGNKK